MRVTSITAAITRSLRPGAMTTSESNTDPCHVVLEASSLMILTLRELKNVSSLSSLVATQSSPPMFPWLP